MNTLPITPGNKPGDYAQPSPEVETVCQAGSPPLYHNAAYAQRPEPRHLRLPGESHRRGTCGGMAGLCGHCFDLQLGWHKQVAVAITKTTPPQPGESYHDYAPRVRARYLDTWCEAFHYAVNLHRTQTA